MARIPRRMGRRPAPPFEPEKTLHGRARPARCEQSTGERERRFRPLASVRPTAIRSAVVNGVRRSAGGARVESTTSSLSCYGQPSAFSFGEAFERWRRSSEIMNSARFVHRTRRRACDPCRDRASDRTDKRRSRPSGSAPLDRALRRWPRPASASDAVSSVCLFRRVRPKHDTPSRQSVRPSLGIFDETRTE